MGRGWQSAWVGKGLAGRHREEECGRDGTVIAEAMLASAAVRKYTARIVRVVWDSGKLVGSLNEVLKDISRLLVGNTIGGAHDK
ncbi:hypothetical protein CFIMG_004999RAa [Ceratocystis fimbriata CBS 114723]|uniref:Uncharacterized protein n=1 Tax=Ceratocystis fimbriata CBS 114723 TaxID=1035309 RepID=A0A2C5X7T3_9PEZI|nr:hypothetical protein CFIMG_004999RAa [Ceratocystis fimbriata CBS 114723]